MRRHRFKFQLCLAWLRDVGRVTRSVCFTFLVYTVEILYRLRRLKEIMHVKPLHMCLVHIKYLINIICYNYLC